MASSDSVNLRHSSTSSANTGKAPKYLGRRQPQPIVLPPLRSRPNVMPYLAQLSNAPGESFTDYRYVTDGRGTYVYVVDSGVNWGNDIFNNEPILFKDVTHEDEDGIIRDYHGAGTNVAALAAGKYMGVTPEARLGVIKVTFRGEVRQLYSLYTLSIGVLSALQHIISSGMENSSVICISLRKYIVHTFLWAFASI